MKWVPEYNTGIDVIDDQHKRILDYINEIVEISDGTDRARVKQILDKADSSGKCNSIKTSHNFTRCIPT